MTLEIERHSFPPKRTEPEMSKPVETPFPRPRVNSEDPIPRYAEKPGPVSDLEAYAIEHGWRVLLTYSEGYQAHATTGKPLKALRTKWALRMVRQQERAVAVRTNGDWTSFWFWSPVQFFAPATGLHDFEKVIR